MPSLRNRQRATKPDIVFANPRPISARIGPGRPETGRFHRVSSRFTGAGEGGVSERERNAAPPQRTVKPGVGRHAAPQVRASIRACTSSIRP